MPNVPNSNVITQGVNSGISRNDGTNGYGTPAKNGQIIWNFPSGPSTTPDNKPTEEFPDSPTIERAEQCTCVHRYSGSYNNLLNLLQIYGRGALVTDAGGNYYRVLSSSLQYQKGGMGIFTMTSESISFDVPPDEFQLTPVKLGLDIMKHPRYSGALMPTNQIPNYTGPLDTDAQIAAKQAIIRAIQAYRENPYIPTSALINGMTGMLHDQITIAAVSGQFVVAKPNPAFNPGATATGPDPIGGPTSSNPALIYYSVNTSSSDPNGKIALALAAAQEIIGKLWRMEDTPPVSGVEMTHTFYSFLPQYLNLGGYVEDPFGIYPTAGIPTADYPVPDYFYSTDFPPDTTNTIWDKLSVYNPQCYSKTGQYNGGTSFSWLRDADVQEVLHGILWRTTRKWLGATVGTWDYDINGALYSGGNRPTMPSQYRNLILS